MSLRLIQGPPNSGRAGLVRRRFVADLPHQPLLVVPNLDDVFSFERELCETGGAMIGGSVVTFSRLFGEVARACGESPPAELSGEQRIALLRLAARRTELRLLARSARRRGFAGALEELIGELQSASLDPDSVESSAGTLEDSAYLREIAAIQRTYLEQRDARNRGDSHLTAALALRGLRTNPDAWGRRPVYLYGFDDLTVEQRELIGALARATDVTVALTYEDRTALAARARLLGDLGEFEPAETEQLQASEENTESRLLFGIERGFAEPDGALLEPDESLTLLRSAGERGEAEAIASEIAHLLVSGTPAEQIAVALRDPAARGPLYERVLTAAGIPVAVEATAPISASATGGAILAALNAVLGTQSAEDVLAFLRAPGRAAPGAVDWLERRIRRGRLRTASEALAAWNEKKDRRDGGLGRLAAAAGDRRALLAEVAVLARDIAGYPIKREGRREQPPGPLDQRELRAAAAIATTAEALLELEGAEPAPEELIETIEGLEIELWRGPAEGRVRVASPYRLRAGRFRAVFVASLQDGEFPRHGSGGPFLSDEQRGALRLPERAEREAEERYIFYVCLSLPTERLFLSYRPSDEGGGAEQRSPLIDQVRALLAPPRQTEGSELDPVEARITRGRDLGDVVLDPAGAPSEDELARALAVRKATATGSGLEIKPALAARIDARLISAEGAVRNPGPLEHPAVLAEMGERNLFSGTSLETFAVCPYRWFVDRELSPQPLGPNPEPLLQGSIMHAALEALYRERPGGDPMPRPGSIELWVERSSMLVTEQAAEAGLSNSSAVDRASRRRVEKLLEAFLRREALRSPLLEPKLLEADFGLDEDSEKPPLVLDGLSLKGQIDRVDANGREALVHDYKLGSTVHSHSKFEQDGKLQLPLYMRAVQRLWNLDPVGGAYQPLSGVGDKARPRGLGLKGEKDEALRGLDLRRDDWIDAEALEGVLIAAEKWAADLAGEIRAGQVVRKPIGDVCPKWCTYAPICRRERGPLAERDDDEEEGQ